MSDARLLEAITAGLEDAVYVLRAEPDFALEIVSPSVHVRGARDQREGVANIRSCPRAVTDGATTRIGLLFHQSASLPDLIEQPTVDLHEP